MHPMQIYHLHSLGSGSFVLLDIILDFKSECYWEVVILNAPSGQFALGIIDRQIMVSN